MSLLILGMVAQIWSARPDERLTAKKGNRCRKTRNHTLHPYRHFLQVFVVRCDVSVWFYSSPKRDGSNDSRSDESWQSPVLGESVSMIAESMGQESTKQQLGVIIVSVFHERDDLGG